MMTGKAMTMKEWYALVISGAALILSSMVAYRTSFRETYDVQAIVNSASITIGDPNDPVLSVGFDPDIVFVNNGNRAVSIIQMELVVHEVSRFSASCDGEFSGDVRFRYPSPDSFEPIVVAPSDAQVLRPRFLALRRHTGGPVTVQEGNPLERTTLRSGAFGFQACLVFDLVVPGIGVRRVDALIGFTAQQPDMEISRLTPYGNGRPIVLIKESRLQLR